MGILNRGDLEYLLNRPSLSIYGKEIYPNIYLKGAALMEALLRRHVFSDGNKRTALLAAQVYFKKNQHVCFLPLSAVRFSVIVSKTTESEQVQIDRLINIIADWLRKYVSPISDERQIRSVYETLLDEINTLSKVAITDMERAQMIFDDWLAIDIYPEYAKDKDQIMDFIEQNNLQIRKFMDEYYKS